MKLYKHEIFTGSNNEAYAISEGFPNSSIHAYNITSDEEYFMVTCTNKFSHYEMVKKLGLYEYEDLITTEV